MAGNFWARTGQATASQFGDASGWQLPTPDRAGNSESFRRRFWLATSEPGRGTQQQVISATLLAGDFWAGRGKQQRAISATHLAGNFRARTGPATANHFGDAFGWQLLSPDRGQATASHFGDAFRWVSLGLDGASTSESFRRRFSLATSEPGRGKQQRVISATLSAGNF